MKKTTILTAAASILVLLPGLQAQENATGKYKVNFYGHIKTDMIYDEHAVSGDDYSYYVTSEQPVDRDLRISARGTRFGLDITDGDKVSGKIETDFLGLSEANAGQAAGSTADLRLRHAYLALKSGRFEFLAGQTWQLTPLEFSGTNNEFALGYSGVLWMRAPQMRLTFRQNDRFNWAVAAVRPTRKLTDSEGTASGLPQMQAQTQVKFGKARFTLMGAWGQWRNASTLQKGEVLLADLGYNLPLNSFLTLNGQLWTGQNLYDFLGGIGNMGYGSDEVRASGGFANLLIKPAGKFSFNLAYGFDDPLNSDIAAATTARTRNSTLLANVSWLVYEKVTFTLEASRQVTEYKLVTGCEDRENLHYQLSAKFPF